MTKLPSVDVRVANWRDDWGRIWRTVGWVLLVLGALGIFGSLLPRSADEPPPAADEAERGIAGSVGIVGVACWALWRRTVTIDRSLGELRIRRGVGPFSRTAAHPLAGLERVTVVRTELTDRSRSVECRVNVAGGERTIRLASFHASRSFASDAGAEADRVAAEFARDGGWEFHRTPRGFSPSELHR